MDKVKIFLSVLLLSLLVSCRNHQFKNYNDIRDTELLFSLIEKRLQVAPLVAESKWNTKAPIDDPVRERMILNGVKMQAKELEIDEELAVSFFQAQFDAGKIVQRQFHEKWEKINQGEFIPASSLSMEVRPVLDSLTPLLLRELKSVIKISCKNSVKDKLWHQARKTISKNFDDQVVQIAIDPVIINCK